VTDGRTRQLGKRIKSNFEPQTEFCFLDQGSPHATREGILCGPQRFLVISLFAVFKSARPASKQLPFKRT